jgi:hypothetical protein
VPRRVSVPDDLFRPTVVPSEPEPAETAATPDEPTGSRTRSPSGRVRHDEKMTVYVTAEELIDLEHARLTLRRAGIGVDRGRLVREAIAIALADLDANGPDSVLAQRLSR